ncbi:hypothetical protein HON22_02250, partial [Candidatus Peregrinibacteria bacterium]|nr:hypothetical protein [Candidatus Peregrinibacteria bacterium]
MRSLIVIALLIGSGIIYLNLVIAQNEESKHQRFIISQEEKAIESESLSASLLSTTQKEVVNEAEDVKIQKLEESDVGKNISSVLEDLKSNSSEAPIKNNETEYQIPQLELIKTVPG